MTSSTCMSPMTEHTGCPLLLDVRGRRVLVVGGGPIAARRMQGLLDAGAEVHVVTPFVCEDVWDAATAGKVTVQLREFAAEDLSDVWLVHTATGDRPTDRLAPLALLDALDPAVEVIDAGKAPHAHTLIQDEINALIVERARSGKRVVRLKGGAPFVLGRGSEEVAACRDAGVAVTVVPGVTSALAAPAAAGIPVTARGITSRFSVVSGHDGPLDFASLAAIEGTLLFMMGVARLPEIARELMTNGRSATEPVAVIENGTTPEQRVTQATLATIAERAAARGVRSPAVIVVGDVAALADL
jgi:uroporphyrin-III C-methyltransferase